MKKILTLLAAVAMIISCDESKETVDSLSFPSDAFITFQSPTASVSENATSPVGITVTYANTSSVTEDVSIDFTVTSNNGTVGTDFNVVDSKSSFTFSPSASKYTDTVWIMPVDNGVLGSENIVVNLTLGSSSYTTGYPGPDGIGKTVALTIMDDDCAREDALRPFEGTWTGDDNCGQYTGVSFTTELPCGTGLLVRGIGYSWMQDTGFWDEVIIEEHPVFITIDAAAGTVEVAEQLYLTTTWNGAVQPTYTLVGSGTIDTSGPKPVIHFVYDMIQGSTGMSTRGGSPCTGLFEADFTLD